MLRALGYSQGPYSCSVARRLLICKQALIAQRNRDDSIYELMKTIEDMHSFVEDAEPLKKVKSQQKMMENMSRLTMESAYFIRDYTADKNFCKAGFHSQQNVALTSRRRETFCKVHCLRC